MSSKILLKREYSEEYKVIPENKPQNVFRVPILMPAKDPLERHIIKYELFELYQTITEKHGDKLYIYKFKEIA